MKKFIYILFVLFVLGLSGCTENSKYTKPNQAISINKDMHIAHIQLPGYEISEDIPLNYLTLTGKIENDKILESDNMYAMIQDQYDDSGGSENVNYKKSFINNIKKCYHPILFVNNLGDIYRMYCLSDGANISLGVYSISTGFDEYDSQSINKNLENMGLFYQILHNNDSEALSLYINQLRIGDLYIKNDYNKILVSVQKYKEGILGIYIYSNREGKFGLGLKYWLFQGRQYDFAMNSVDDLDDNGGSLFDFGKIPDISKYGCINKYNDKMIDLPLSNDCYNYIKGLFEGENKNQEFENYLDETKKIIDKIIE